MKLQISRFCLDTIARTLTSASEQQTIRPKTMTLLLFMIERRGAIVSKDELLNHIWNDVTVDEGVIFQSIREIRQLFTGIVVIQNHPRKGYQWVVEVVPVVDNTSPQSTNNNMSSSPLSVLPRSRRFHLQRWTLVLLLIGILFGIGLQSKNNNIDLAIMPVQNYVDRNDLDWFESRGAAIIQQAIENKLLNTPAGEYAEFTLTTDQNDSIETDSAWHLSTSVYGDVYEYKVVYSLVNVRRQYRGVVFAHSIESAVQQLVEVTLKNTGQEGADSTIPASNVVQDPEFANAMIAYETDWDSAIRELKTYLVKNPESVLAQQYLSRLYIWKGDIDLALDLINKGLAYPKLTPLNKSELLFNYASAYQYTHPELALAKISRGIRVAEESDTWLSRAKLEELRADIFHQQNHPVDALRGYLKALSFYDQIQASVKIAGLQLKLAALYIGNQQPEMARQVFLKAKTAIQQYEMSFMYATLLEFEMQHRVLSPHINSL